MRLFECKKIAHAYIAVHLIVCMMILSVPAYALSQKFIQAKAAVVTDSTGTVIFGKFPNARLAGASTVKLVTAMVAIDNLYPWAKVTISSNAAKVHSIRPHLHADDEITVSDLLHIALMNSVNSAAVALAEATVGSEQSFVALMNLKAREIGAMNTHFSNASGLPTKDSQYTTASDLTIILKAALSYPLIREILGKKDYLVITDAGREIALENTDNLLWTMDTMIGGKTGYTGTARHCFVCAIKSGESTLFTAVMGAKSRKSLWTSTLMLQKIGMYHEDTTLQGKPLSLALTL
jgi:serine-type D-Ala-D-Ala carboxypeptidase (penicillin-binding protein 5/6)